MMQELDAFLSNDKYRCIGMDLLLHLGNIYVAQFVDL